MNTLYSLGDFTKICVIASAGGHLTEVMQVKSAYSKYEYFYVTFNRKDAREKLKGERKYFINDPKRNPVKFMSNFVRSLWIFFKEMPEVIITTGAGMAIPFCYISKLFGKKVVFIETLAAINRASFSGRMIYPVSDLFITQWKNNLRFYPDGVYGGTIL
jgi:beta-1,4-N-acetylglucosaminyltransferase